MDNILSWNVRGLDSKKKQVEVTNFLISHNIRLFSLLETKVKAPNLGDLMFVQVGVLPLITRGMVMVE